MDNISYNELFSEYYKLIQEKNDMTFEYMREYINSFNKLNDESRKKLYNVFHNYLNSYQTYKKVLNFMILNKNKITYDNASYILDLLDEQYEELLTSLFYILQDYNIASNMHMDYKFNPNKDLSLDNYNKYINYIKGFNIDNISNFLIDNDVYTPELFDSVYNDFKVIDCSYDDYYVYSGVNSEGNVMVPKVKDELSTLINIHELVHKRLLLCEKEIDNNLITNSEILPIFYEKLFKMNNKFCKLDIHNLEIVNMLINDYQNETFGEQIWKLKKII